MNTAAKRSAGLGWRVALVATLGYAGLALLLLEPALRGSLVSDDALLFVAMPYLEDLTLENVRTILEPRGEPVRITANWAPVHLLAHALGVEAFGSPLENPYPHHLVNGIVHGVNATLFAALLAAAGVPVAAALAAALLFLVHPANVETAAWIFQLKTLLAFAFGFGALLGLPRRPALATLLFALALLSKPSAAAVLATAIVGEWQRDPAATPEAKPRRTRWLFGWGLLLLLYALPEFTAFRHIGEFRDVLPPATQALQVVAILGRYGVLALTSAGSSTFHQPTPPESPFDFWFALGLVTLLGLGAVSVRALVRRHPAASWLGLAVAAYLPVAQLFPFRYPMADRYLYFVLPGLLGALALTFAPSLAAAGEAWRARGWRAGGGGLLAAGLAFAALAGVFSWRFYERAVVWRSPERVERDAAAHYPDGIPGQITLARRRIAQGDLDGAVRALERARARGHSNPAAFLRDPSFEPLLEHPRYLAMLRDMTERWIERFATIPDPSVSHLIGLAQAELFLGRVDRAREAFARAEAGANPVERAVIQRMQSELDRMLESSEAAPQ